MDKILIKLYSNKNGYFLELDLKAKKCGNFMLARNSAVYKDSGKQQTWADVYT